MLGLVVRMWCLYVGRTLFFFLAVCNTASYICIYSDGGAGADVPAVLPVAVL